ncbi:MAG: flavoprotein, partial [Actinomycetia bacterium]|nr:flavoprotein [Actinomycetes bacterium]
MSSTVGIVASAAGGVESLREALVEPLLDRNYRVSIVLTPTAAIWLDANGERAKLAELPGLPVRSHPRMPTEPSPHPT